MCDGSFSHHELVKSVRDLYDSTRDNPHAFIEAVADQLHDGYEFQKLCKRVTSGEYFSLCDKSDKRRNFVTKVTRREFLPDIGFREHHLPDTCDTIGPEAV